MIGGAEKVKALMRCPATADGKCLALTVTESRDTKGARLWLDVCDEQWRQPLDASIE